MSAPQHAGLSVERWLRHPRGQQILMVANEMNRASKLLGPDDQDRLRTAYERVLALTDLTIRANEGRSFRREMLRWRDLVAALYVASTPDARAHGAAFRVLLQFHPEAWRQLPFVTGSG